MNDCVEKYFRADTSCLFHWADGGKTLCWLDGTTIAFRDELVIVLDRLALGSLPALTSIAVAQAALRESWPEVVERMNRVLRALQNSAIPSYADAMRRHRYLTDTWPDSVRKLTRLGRYAQSKATSLSERAELLAALFERLDGPWTADEQREIADSFRAGLPADWLFERPGDSSELHLPNSDDDEERWRQSPPLFHRVLHDFLNLLRIARVIAGGLEADDDAGLNRSITTGLSGELNAPKLEFLPDARLATRKLIDELSDDREFAGLASLVKHVLAAVSLPRSLEISHDSATGGVSDISNRGELDRLLLSELAHDDTTLAVRIALNEALYLRRETPPQPLAQMRPVLIDNSLPLWGLPRVYATAIALALQAGAEKGVRCKCWRPDGEQVTGVHLTTREGVAEHLSTLSPAAHSGDALASFQRAIHDSQEPNAEAVIITTEDVLAADDFRRSLDDAQLGDQWIITVERDGRLTVHHRTRQGMSVYRRAKLPVDEILGEADRVLSAADDRLPAVFGLSEFPLFLSHQTRIGRLWKWDTGAVSLSDDGRLMHWPGPYQGARELLSGIPVEKHMSSYVVARSTSWFRLLVVGKRSVLLTVRRPGFVVERVDVDHRCAVVHAARIYGATLLVFGTDGEKSGSCSAVSPITGQHLGNVGVNPVPVLDRCIPVGGPPAVVWCVLSWDGSNFETDTLPEAYRRSRAVVETSEGRFVRISENNELIDSEDSTWTANTLHLAPSLTLHGFAPFLPGNSWLCVHTSGSDFAVNIETGEVRSELHSAVTVEELEFYDLRRHVRLKTPHWKFAAIGVDSDLNIRLRSPSGSLFEINLCSGRIHLHPCPLRPDISMTQFDRSPVGPLQPATLGDGGRAWLDQRGLLHLKGSDPAVPEVTLVMCDGELSGWTSDGQLFGINYHCGSGEVSHGLRVTPKEAWESSIVPLLKSILRQAP